MDSFRSLSRPGNTQQCVVPHNLFANDYALQRCIVSDLSRSRVTVDVPAYRAYALFTSSPVLPPCMGSGHAECRHRTTPVTGAVQRFATSRVLCTPGNNHKAFLPSIAVAVKVYLGTPRDEFNGTNEACQPARRNRGNRRRSLSVVLRLPKACAGARCASVLTASDEVPHTLAVRSVWPTAIYRIVLRTGAVID